MNLTLKKLAEEMLGQFWSAHYAIVLGVVTTGRLECFSVFR